MVGALMLRRSLSWLFAVAACGSGQGARPDAAPGDTAEPPDALVSLPIGVGHYHGACDGSAAVALDFDHFVEFSDEDQLARFYDRGATQPPTQIVDLTAALGLVGNGEADFEDALQQGDRIYVIGSHGRTGDGTLDRNRYHLLAIDLALQPVGHADTILDDLLDRATWAVPDDTVIAALANASQLDDPKDSDLEPKLAGTNIEGLARAPTAAAPERLAIGFRNPRLAGRAIVVTLLNPAAAVAGARAQFGEAFRLDLGDLGIRALAWSDPLAAMLVLAGPHDDGDGPFKIYRWLPDSGTLELLTELLPPAGAHPEAIVTYPNTRDVQILFDNDNVLIAGTPCANAASDAQEFFDQIVHIE